jgi:hypothetical protein
MDHEWIELLDYISQQLNRYFALIIFLFGIIGCVLNCLVLSQRQFRLNPCALYFFVSSIVNLISILFGLTTRIMAGWNYDPSRTIGWICKFRAFIVFTSRTIAIWLIMLATIDRWLLSSMDFSRRHRSTMKNTKRGILISFILSIIFYIHMFYCYEANILNAPLKCYGKSIQCRFITDLIYAFVTILIPSIVMIIFGLMIVSNVRHLRLRVQTMTIVSIIIPSKTKELKLKKTDRQLLRMLLVQVLLLIIFCIPQVIQKFYITFKPFGSVNYRLDAINYFLYNIEVLLAFIASGIPFYLYTLSGGVLFRKASMDLIKKIYQKIICRL